MLKPMSELDEFWSDQLSEAAANARTAGRADVADFLSLKAKNDAVRIAEINDLFAMIIGAAMSDEHRSRNIVIDRESPHNFLHRKANLVGAMLKLRLGVRCMTVEAGWTRTPSDGFMRLGALAFARITHFGVPKGNMELALVADSGKSWQIVKEERSGEVFAVEHCSLHIAYLIG
jgi:hypothetical protein